VTLESLADVLVVALDEPQGNRLRALGVCRAPLEATASYGRGVRRYLEEIGTAVLQLQPAQVKAYAAIWLPRAKTDRLDAALIAA